MMKVTNQHNHRRRTGSVLPLMALSITVLLGCAALVADYGVLLADKNQLQRACDASALGGAGYLKRTGNDDTDTANATRQALLISTENKLAPGEVTPSSITYSDNNTKITVAAKRERSLFFARVLGIFRGTVNATATAVVAPGVAPPVPIAITTVSKARYQSDGLPHTFTLVRPQDTAFATNYTGVAPFDPFTVFDLRGNQAKSPTFMQRQLEGDLNDPVNPQIGDTLTGMALNLGPMSSAFKDGIAPRFAKAAGTPWLDPPVTIPVLTSAWSLVGTRYADILNGNMSPNNPRLVRFVVLDEVNTPVSNYDYPIVDFASAYINSVQESAGGLTMTATFLPPGAGNDAASVTLIN